MNQEQFSKLIAEILESTADLLVRKGAEYASDADRLHNFKHNAELLGMSPLQVWSVYAFKHIDAIQSYMRKIHDPLYHHPSLPAGIIVIDRQLSEPIEGRFHDAINYMFLGLALLQEIKYPPEPKQGGVIEVKRP